MGALVDELQLYKNHFIKPGDEVESNLHTYIWAPQRRALICMGFWNHRTQSNYSVLVYLTRTLFTCSMNFTLQAGHRHSQQQNLSHSSSTFLLYSTLYHLSQPGQVMFLAKSQWKHLRACTVEVEKIKTAVTNPNIFTNNHSLVSKSASWFDVLLFQIITNSLLSHCPSHHRVLGDTCFPENTELWSLFSPECHRRCATTDWLRITLAGAGPPPPLYFHRLL